jgi:hypothetical protein
VFPTERPVGERSTGKESQFFVKNIRNTHIYMHVLCGSDVYILSLNLVVHIITTTLQNVNQTGRISKVQVSRKFLKYSAILHARNTILDSKFKSRHTNYMGAL